MTAPSTVHQHRRAADGGDIAVIGMAGRFPGAADLKQFWANLCAGVESISALSDEELLAAGASPEDLAAPGFVKAGSKLDGIDLFDAEFFGYTAREARLMDPQHRLFLETSWEALEHAAYDPFRRPGRIGVFGGAGSNGYLLNVYSNPAEVETAGTTQVLVANELNFLASRVSYKLDLCGPSVALRTACSTSLVAVHLACRSLRDGESDLALAGGAHVYIGQDAGYWYEEGSFASPDGHCRPFDAAAAGTVFGSGVGVVVLRRLADAIDAGDVVHAVIKGSAVNNDGSLKAGFTAPSVPGQATAVRDALAAGGIDPATVGYVEAHGTGTVLGDPVEFTALREAFGPDVPAGSVALGSVKSNVGHLDAAAGMAGLLKAVHAVREGVLPASLNFAVPNPALELAGSPFRIQSETAEWESGTPRRAGVSAFGFGGTNAHVVVEQPPPRAHGSPSARGSQLLVLSARTPSALEAATGRLAEALAGEPDADLPDVAFTLAVGRREFPYRRAVTATGTADAAAVLDTLDPARTVSRGPVRGRTPVGFILSGQGGPLAGTAAGLYAAEPVFAAAVDECATGLARLAEETQGTPEALPDVRDVLVAGTDPARRTDAAQPALFALEYALVRLWESWGVRPAVLLGHSVGEVVAACVAGVCDLPGALRLVAARGRLMQEAEAGAMVSVAADRDTVTALLPPGASLAAHNGPGDCVVSGRAEVVAAFTDTLAGHGISWHQVSSTFAFHSELMDKASAAFADEAAALRLAAPSVPLVSTVTGDRLTAGQATDPAYWGGQIRSCVEFATGLGTLLADDPGLALVEIGPGRTLSSLVRRAHPGRTVVASLPHPADGGADAVAAIQRAAGQLWVSGAEVDWAGFYAAERRVRTPLPTYPFERKRYWLSEKPAAAQARTAAGGTGRRADVAQWFSVPSWRAAPAPRAEAGRPGGRWLVFTDEHGLGAELAELLRGHGAHVTTVAAGAPGTPAERVDGTSWRLDPAAEDGYHELLDALAEEEALPDGVAHCWSVTGTGDPADSAADGHVTRGFSSLVALAKALGRQVRGESELWIVSDGMHVVTGAEHVRPAKATALGPARVIPREFPRIRCVAVDVDLTTEPAAAVAGRLVREFSAARTEEPGAIGETVALRGRHRWTLGHAPYPLPPAPEPMARPGGTYLVTGGLGGLGLALAEHLVGLGASVALTARTPLPGDWASTVDTLPEGPRRDALKRLRRHADHVLVCRADVADPGEMRAAVATVHRRFGRIDGVFHTAGVAGGGLIQIKDAAAADAVLRPKVAGTLVLDTVLRETREAGEEPPEFLVLFSSNAANIGNVGQVDYCAANCFLDAFAQSSSGRTRVVAVDWGPWREVGMSVTTDVPVGMSQARDRDVAESGMSPGEGLDALSRVLSAEPAQVVVSPRSLDELLDGVVTLDPDDPELAGALAVVEPAGTRHPRPDLTNPYVPPRTAEQQSMCQVWQDLLGIDRIGIHDNFFELGGNSLIALRLIAAMNRDLGTSLTPVQLYDVLTVAGLAPDRDGTGQAAGTEPAVPAINEERLLAERREHVRQRREQQRRRRTKGNRA